MTSAKSLLPASDTTRILAPSTHGIRVISMKLPSVIFGRLICHDYRGWIIPYARTFTIDRASIYHFVMSMPSCTVNQLLQSTTIIVYEIYNIYKFILKIVPWYFLKGKTPHHMHKKIYALHNYFTYTTHQLA